MKGINIFLADGFEDMEALATNDVLKRGGLDVNLVSIYDDTPVSSSHGVIVDAAFAIDEVDLNASPDGPEDIMIFPGGMPGTKNLAACEPLMKAMKAHYAAGGTLAAICAAPGLVLGRLDSLEGVEFTCFEGFEELPQSKGGKFVPAPAVRSGRIITGRSAGHAVTFGLEILGYLHPERVEDVKHSLYLWTV